VAALASEARQERERQRAAGQHVKSGRGAWLRTAPDGLGWPPGSAPEASAGPGRRPLASPKPPGPPGRGATGARGLGTTCCAPRRDGLPLSAGGLAAPVCPAAAWMEGLGGAAAADSACAAPSTRARTSGLPAAAELGAVVLSPGGACACGACGVCGVPRRTEPGGQSMARGDGGEGDGARKGPTRGDAGARPAGEQPTPAPASAPAPASVGPSPPTPRAPPPPPPKLPRACRTRRGARDGGRRPASRRYAPRRAASPLSRPLLPRSPPPTLTHPRRAPPSPGVATEAQDHHAFAVARPTRRGPPPSHRRRHRTRPLAFRHAQGAVHTTPAERRHAESALEARVQCRGFAALPAPI